MGDEFKSDRIKKAPYQIGKRLYNHKSTKEMI